MFLRCPLCGSELYYLEGHSSFVSFRIDLAGCAAEMRPKDAKAVLSPETTVHCLACAWCGPVQELQASA